MGSCSVDHFCEFVVQQECVLWMLHLLMLLNMASVYYSASVSNPHRDNTETRAKRQLQYDNTLRQESQVACRMSEMDQ